MAVVATGVAVFDACADVAAGDAGGVLYVSGPRGVSRDMASRLKGDPDGPSNDGIMGRERVGNGSPSTVLSSRTTGSSGRIICSLRRSLYSSSST